MHDVVLMLVMVREHADPSVYTNPPQFVAVQPLYSVDPLIVTDVSIASKNPPSAELHTFAVQLSSVIVAGETTVTAPP